MTLAVKGFIQRYGINYVKIFALVTRQKTIKMVISLPAQTKWSIHHMDAKGVFLNGYLKDKVYVQQSQEFDA